MPWSPPNPGRWQDRQRSAADAPKALATFDVRAAKTGDVPLDASREDCHASYSVAWRPPHEAALALPLMPGSGEPQPISSAAMAANVRFIGRRPARALS